MGLPSLCNVNIIRRWLRYDWVGYFGKGHWLGLNPGQWKLWEVSCQPIRASNFPKQKRTLQRLPQSQKAVLQFRWIMTSISFERLELLKEEYEYYEKVGSGKFGSVYRVICKTTGETSFCYSSQRWYDVVIFVFKIKCPFQELYLQQNMFNAGEQVKRQDWWKK